MSRETTLLGYENQSAAIAPSRVSQLDFSARSLAAKHFKKVRLEHVAADTREVLLRVCKFWLLDEALYSSGRLLGHHAIWQDLLNLRP